MTRGLQRAPLVAAALAAMTWGIWMGLLRLGWALPLPWPDQLILHGPLMIGGFLGTLIGLERAVGIARPWAYAAPVLTAVGSTVLVLGPPGAFGPLLVTAGSAVVLGVFFVVIRRQPSLFAWTMAMGSASWFAGNVQWLSGAGTYRVVFWWVGFLILTIAGERLELNRVRRPGTMPRIAFVAAVVIFASGVVLAAARPEAGVRLLGAGLVALAGWLATFDIARHTVRMSGITRFMAACMLSGYAWLFLAGVIAIVAAPSMPGTVYDALVHAITLGFAMAMIFAHAPVVFPAITGLPLPFRNVSYMPLALLHASVAVRLIGDLAEEFGRWRAWGGLLNAAAIAMFVAMTIWSIRRSR